MSMLSMQIDGLRRWADLYDGTTKPEMAKELQRPYLAQELRDAADTILELRDDLQRANSNLQDAEHDESVAWDRVRKAERESARLRELVRDMWFWSYEGHIDSESQERQMLHIDAVIQRMRELGVEEVDG